MSDGRRERSDDAPEAAAAPSTQVRSGHRPVELRHRVVEYDDGPDRWTVAPVLATRDERMTRWLTATTDLVVDLKNWR
jgi:hypothetical protein